MKRLGVALLAGFIILLSMVGCGDNTAPAYMDGTYRAEYATYDSFKYKDYLVVTVEEGVITAIEFDAINAEGALRSQDEKYRNDMEKVQGTHPAKYAADLINQYLENSDISTVDTVAGATLSSETFLKLFEALQENMKNGDTATVILTDTPLT